MAQIIFTAQHIIRRLMLIKMFIDLSVCSRAMLCKHRFHVNGIRSQGSKLSNLFMCSLNQLAFLGIAHRSMSSSVLRRVGTDEYQAMLVCKEMQTEWSSETLMVRFVEQDGANTRILATGDANTQKNDFHNFRIYTPRIQITCSSSEKPRSRATLITYTSHERNALCDWRYSTNCRGISWRRQTTALFWRRSR